MPDKIAKFIKSLDGKTRLRLKRRLLRLEVEIMDIDYRGNIY